MNQKELQQLVESISMEYFQKPFNHEAVFNKRLRTTGGRYHLKTHHLDFNPAISDELGDEVLIGIIKHELCHYHLHLEGKGHQHKDKAFKDLLKEVGGLRFVPSRKEKQQMTPLWQYRCGQCGIVVGRKRRFNTEKYVCSSCRGSFTLIGKRTA
ncbi:SprT family protein [Alkalibacterium sp. MB6]|uniref:SprT family protein n=1 Tax=Alkalibacterium sp. MB6 TaxID=2081965 RepID=UPI001379BDDA|nr:SprT family protein [Alkalibacterium sp. MB6]